MDDNEVDRLVVRRILELSGRFGEIVSVADGREALALYQGEDSDAGGDAGRFPPRLVLLDINMPRMNGFAFLEEYRRLDLDVERHFVLMLTSSTAETDQRRAEAEDLVEDYLIKPLTVEKAVEIADRYLGPAAS